MKKVLVLVAVMGLSVLSGCMSTGRKVDQSALDRLQKGMTKQEVVSLLGSPANESRQSSGETIFMYTYARAKQKAVNFVPIVGMFAGGMDADMQTVTVMFGTDDKVKDFTISQGSGGSVEPGVIK